MSEHINSESKTGHVWRLTSEFTVRQDEVGRCAEKNCGTPNCTPGKCELCGYCSCNPKNNESSD